MLKLIVADFDGTLMQYGEKCVSDRVINKIKEYLDNGIHFAVASGRTYSELSALLKEISDEIKSFEKRKRHSEQRKIPAV